MKTITEIFATNPDLLNQPEVKELVEQFYIQFEAMKRKHMDYWDKVTTLTMSSELFVTKGDTCKKVVEEINNISFDMPF